MRVVEEPLQVDASDGKPLSFEWRGTRFRVSHVLDTWTTQERRGWVAKKLEKRRHFRVHADHQYRCRVTAELYAAERGEKIDWVLSAVYD